jgi:hypothetical protein
MARLEISKSDRSRLLNPEYAAAGEQDELGAAFLGKIWQAAKAPPLRSRLRRRFEVSAELFS